MTKLISVFDGYIIYAFIHLCDDLLGSPVFEEGEGCVRVGYLVLWMLV